MNSSEEKQVFLLGRILQRDPQRVATLLDQDKLKVPQEALDFSKDIIEHSIQLSDHAEMEAIYIDKYQDTENSDNYHRVMSIFSHQA